MKEQTDLEGKFHEQDAQDIVEMISFPRLAGSEGAKKAVKLITEKFHEIEVDLIQEKFQATKFWIATATQAGTTLVLLLTIIMIIISQFSPAWNLLLIIGILGVAVWGLSKASDGEKKLIGKPIDTENLVAKIPAIGEKKGIIILMGHHDTKSQVLTTLQRSAGFTFGAAALLFMVFTYLIQGIIVLIGNSIPQALMTTSYVFAAITIFFVIPIMFNFTQNKSPGTLDNASSIAALYMLGKYFSEEPLQNHEIWLVMTGAEELGMLGAQEFAQKHQNEINPQTTYCLNFDMIGLKQAPIEVIETAGFPSPKPVSKKLNGMAREISQKLDYDFNGFYFPIGAATDRCILTKMGVDSMDFLNRNAALHTHTPEDNLERFDPRLAKKFVVVSAMMMEQLDKEIS